VRDDCRVGRHRPGHRAGRRRRAITAGCGCERTATGTGLFWSICILAGWTWQAVCHATRLGEK
jgi:hypothetical protein